MKRFFALALAATLICTAALTMQSFMENDKKVKTDSQGHVLTGLWKSFDDASSADKPKTASSILDQIITKAREDRLNWDFYDAATRKLDYETGMNWKVRDSIFAAINEAFAAYDEPVVTFTRMSMKYRSGKEYDLLSYIKDNADRLKAGRNEGFYPMVGKYQSPEYYIQAIGLSRLIMNDFEYALWKSITGNLRILGDSKTSWVDEAVGLLTTETAGRYPESQYLEFLVIMADTDHEAMIERLKEFAQTNKGRTIRLRALSALGKNEKSELDSRNASSEDFQAFYRKCLEWENERKAFKSGAEGEIARNITSFSLLIKELKSSQFGFHTQNDSLILSFRNLSSATITVTDEKSGAKILQKKVVNPVNSFYRWDKVTLAMPASDDGDYSIVCRWGATNKEDYSIQRRSLSIAMREDSEGMKFYVADAVSGRPEDTVDLELFRNGKSVAKVSGVAVDGFTPVPEGITKALKKESASFLKASCRNASGQYRESEDIQYGLDWRIRYRNEDDFFGCGDVFTDKAAFNPGETVRFKGVFYERSTSQMKVFPAGRKVTAGFLDPESKEIEHIELETNDFGSVAGEFRIPEGLRNGRFQIHLSCDGADAYGWIRVDEFILPSYELTFDWDDKPYLPGDTVVISGKVASYSGHTLAAAMVTYSLTSDDETVQEGSLELDDNGAFSFSFVASEDDRFYDVTVKVTDATGETREFRDGVFIAWNAYLETVMEDRSKGSLDGGPERNNDLRIMFSGNEKALKINCRDNYRNESNIPAQVTYELTGPSGDVVSSGTAASGEEFILKFDRSGEYVLKSSVEIVCPSGRIIKARNTTRLLRLDDDATTLDADYENVFKLVGPSAGEILENGEGICLQVGTGKGECWIIAELFGDHRNLIERRLVHLAGKPGEAGSLQTLEFAPSPSWDTGLYLQLFYFKKNGSLSFNRTFKVNRQDFTIPISFSRFTDKVLPGSRCMFSFDSSRDAEAVAAVFDKSSEAFASNVWSKVYRPSRSVEIVYISSECGRTLGFGALYEAVSVGSVMDVGVKSARRKMAASNAAVMMDSAPVFEEAVMSAETPAPSAGVGSAEPASMPVAVRSDFSTSLAFEPFLRPDKDGKFSFEFQTSDKLSTFVVQVYAHDKGMRDAMLRREMVVTMPVKVNVTEPKYLYRGDRYVLNATLSSDSEEEISGTVSLNLHPSADREGTKAYSKASRKVVIPAKGSVPVEFEIDTKDHDEVGILVSFMDSGKKYSDAVFVSVPVFEAAQTITEAHSAVLLAGKDKNALLKKLQKEFTGTTHKGAEYSERDIRQMVLDAIPSKFEPKGKDVISLTEAFYVRKVAESLGATVIAEMSDEKLLSQISACRNADGGYGWFQGMKSSPSITAVILERVASLKRLGAGMEDFGTEAAVRYLDAAQFAYDEDLPFWRGYLSTEQYLHVRSLYSDVPFNLTKGVTDKKIFKEFKKYTAGYLVPSASDGRGLQGQILAKARRLSTLGNLLETPSGKDLAAAWGMKFDAASRMKKSLDADVVSLIEYAVGHPDGGWYYPNAVMPWRGLLESELYAHTLLCGLMSGELAKGVSAGASSPVPEEIANGIRLWMMLQKETQNWDSDPAYVDAVGAILAGGDEVLDTKVITLTKTYRKPFKEIAAAGNGFTIERKFFREVSGEGEPEEIVPGTMLHVGDKVIAEYRIWSQENRSFVKLDAFREAAFRPVDQLSGYYGWWLVTFNGRFDMAPQGYRNVKSDVTEYYFDVYPEEKTTVKEEFFVTQEGEFSAPAVTIESLYAPHYRANGAFQGTLQSTDM
ncbi:MAG: MG2 domain-containing protein [Bacteroidales bacterium]|nr:MG2 domain-containing protein [Bacteroidales bacterium]